jgi:ribosome recycling factor
MYIWHGVLAPDNGTMDILPGNLLRRSSADSMSKPKHIKPVRSAIQGSNLSLTPQGPTPETPTTLTITIPPVTGESRQQAIAEANEIAQKSIEEIQQARSEKHKKLRAMLKSRSVVPDDVHMAEKKMQEVVDRGKTEVKKILNGARRVMEGR